MLIQLLKSQNRLPALALGCCNRLFFAAVSLALAFVSLVFAAVWLDFALVSLVFAAVSLFFALVSDFWLLSRSLPMQSLRSLPPVHY
ncbi:hypothetical protein ECZU17_35710 [Escherichia coli]|nr:hypothetical protein ECZU17_35710 [Escherichia coli]